MSSPVVFLDKDGTLVKDMPYNIDPERVVLEKGVARGLRKLHDAGFRLVVITNQSGVARGYFPEAGLKGVEARLNELTEQTARLRLDGFYYCPHHPQGSVAEYAVECNCRKPRPGLLLRAASEMDIDLASAWMVGDILNDVEAGARAGCRTILIDNGSETEWQPGPQRTPDFIATDLEEAAEIIILQEGEKAKTGATGQTPHRFTGPAN